MEDSGSCSSDDEVVVIPYTKPKPPEILLDSDHEIELDNEESTKEPENHNDKEDNDSDLEVIITATTQQESRQKNESKIKQTSNDVRNLTELLLKRHSEVLQSQSNRRNTENILTTTTNHLNGTIIQKAKSPSQNKERTLSNSCVPGKKLTKNNSNSTSSSTRTLPIGNGNSKTKQGATSTISSSPSTRIRPNVMQTQTQSFNLSLSAAQKKENPRLEQLLMMNYQKNKEKVDTNKSTCSTKRVRDQNDNNNKKKQKMRKEPVAKKTRKTKDRLSAADNNSSKDNHNKLTEVEEDVQDAEEVLENEPATISIESDDSIDLEENGEVIPSNHMMCTNYPDCTNSNECGMACYKIELSRNEHRILCQVDQKLQIIKRIRDRSTNKNVTICLLKNLPEIHLCGKFYDELRDRIFSIMYQLTNFGVDKVVQMFIEEENKEKDSQDGSATIPLEKNNRQRQRKRKLPVKGKSKSSSKVPSKTRHAPKKQKKKKAVTIPLSTCTTSSSIASSSKASSIPRGTSLQSTATLPGSKTTTLLNEINLVNESVKESLVESHQSDFTCNNTAENIFLNPELSPSPFSTTCTTKNAQFLQHPPFIALSNPIFYQTLQPPDASSSCLNVNGTNNNSVNTLNRHHDIDERNLPVGHRVSFPVVSPESPFALNPFVACGYPHPTFFCYAGPFQQVGVPYMPTNTMTRNIMTPSTIGMPSTNLSNSTTTTTWSINNSNNEDNTKSTNNTQSTNSVPSSSSSSNDSNISHNRIRKVSNSAKNDDEHRKNINVNMGQHPPAHEQQQDNDSDEITIEAIKFNSKPTSKNDNDTPSLRSSIVTNNKSSDFNNSTDNRINNGTNKESRFKPHPTSQSYQSHYFNNYNSSNKIASTTNSNFTSTDSNSNNTTDPDSNSKKDNRLQKTTVSKCIKNWKSTELRELFLYLNDISMDYGVNIGRVQKGDNLTINIESISLKDLTTAKTKILQRLGFGASKKSSKTTTTTTTNMEKDARCDNDNIGKDVKESNLLKNSKSNDKRINNSQANPRYESNSKNSGRNNNSSSSVRRSNDSNNNTNRCSSDTTTTSNNNNNDNPTTSSSSEDRIRSTKNNNNSRERANSSERESLHGRPSIHRGLHQYMNGDGDSRSLNDDCNRSNRNYQRNDPHSHGNSSRGKGGENGASHNAYYNDRGGDQNYRGQLSNHYSNNNSSTRHPYNNNNNSSNKSTSNADTNYNRHYDSAYEDYFNYNNRYDFEGSHYNNDNRSLRGQQNNPFNFQQ